MSCPFEVNVEIAAGWLEIALDHRCNQRCVGCRACDDGGESLDARAIRRALDAARAEGVRRLWIGGGEPTLREDLFAVIATARRLGFDEVLLQSNALRLAYPAYVDALVAAGVTEVSVNAKSHRPEVHDALSGREGSHALLVRALGNLRDRGVRIACDVLLTRRTVVDLPETIRLFASLGASRFLLWLLSASDAEGRAAVEAEVPRIADLHAPLRAASAIADACGASLRTMHTPPCTLPADLRDRFLPARDLRLRVLDPSGRSFPLESSPFEGGTFLPGCDACALRGRCHGARADYIRLHGESELVPL